MLKKLILSVAILSLAACAFDKDKSKNNSKEAADLQEQSNNFEKVVGTYGGKLTTPSSQQDVELRLFTLSEPIGKNSDGEDIYRLVLRGNYKKLNPVGPGYNFKIRYIPQSSQLIFTNSVVGTAGESNLGPDDIHTINAQIRGQQIVGQVKSVSGVIGALNLTLSSTENNVPGNNEQNEYYERLRRQYESISGTYAGNNVVDGKAKFGFKITLQVIKDGAVPLLIGEFKRDDDPGETVSLTLTAVYQPELTPATLTLTGKPRYNPNNSPYQATFEGTLIGDEYKGSWRTNIKGFEGNFVLRKAH
ncbi:hypothetical protein [Bdellovibrio sp. BCCA]|uniref:hypothetical protein n=1 Tax=Bdellovibrio sp. BCCA TaxID=3136281 RepID=UPI0030F209C2